MIDNRITDNELFSFLLSSGTIDRTTILRNYEMAKRREVLEKHPCRIWQGETNGMWYTYLLENNKRRLIKKKTRKQVEDVIVEFYKDEPTVYEIFQKWIEEKRHYGEISDSSCDRYVADFRRYFEESSLKDKKIKLITENEIEQHIKDQILNYKLTSKAYGGLRTIIIGIFGYAYKHNYTNIPIRTFFNELNLSKNIFYHKPKLSQDNVFTDDETELLKNYLTNHKPNVISYGILLAF